MVTSGVLAELLARVYYESGSSRAYVARERDALPEDAGWHRPGA